MPEIHEEPGSPPRPVPVASCTRNGSDLVLHVRGDLDTATWEEPVAALGAQLPTEADRLVVDLADVRFADSSGLGCLVRLRTLAHEHRIALVLRGPRPQLTRLLRVSGLDGVFDVLPVSTP